MKITKQEVLRRLQLMKVCLLADMRNKKNGLVWSYHQAQHTPTCIIRRENTKQAQPGQTKNYVDGEWSGQNLAVEATRQTKDRN